MRKKHILGVSCIFSVILVACVWIVFAKNHHSGINQDNYNNSGGKILLDNDKPFEGVLSTGAKYEFHGVFNFNEFRKEYNFYLERATGSMVTVNNPTEAAEEGQFYIFPTLRNRAVTGEESWSIVVRYCPETNNWVIQASFSEDARYRLRGEPTIFAINRLTGEVVEFSRNAGSFYMFEPERLGWRDWAGEGR